MKARILTPTLRLHREPIDKHRVLAFDQAAQHDDPRTEHQFRPPFQRARQGLNARPLGAIEFSCLIIQPLRQRTGQIEHGKFQINEFRRKLACRLGKPFDHGQAIGFKTCRLVGVRTRQNLLAHQHQECLARPFRCPARNTPLPTGPRQHPAGHDDLAQELLGLVIGPHQIPQPIGERAPPAAFIFRPTYPAAQFGRFNPGNLG